MNNTYLVQRLEKPFTNPEGLLAKFGEALSFGGGGGKISKEAMDLLRPILRFDYMGSAEFEFGSVPQALGKMAQQSAEYKAFQMIIPRDKIEKPYDRVPLRKKVNGKWVKTTKEVPFRTDDPTVYVCCSAADKVEVENRIVLLAGNELRLKESSDLPRTLDPINDFDSRTVGWLELDNGFAFFTDKEMWEKFCNLFGINVAS